MNCVSRESAEQELGPAADSQHSVTGSGNNIGEGQMHRWEGSESSDVLFVSLQVSISMRFPEGFANFLKKISLRMLHDV